MPSPRAVLADIIQYNLNPNEAHQVRKKHLKKPTDPVDESTVEPVSADKNETVPEVKSDSVSVTVSEQFKVEDKKESTEQNELLVEPVTSTDDLVMQPQLTQKKRVKKLVN